MKYQNILQSFLCHRVNGVNLKMEAVSSEILFRNKHWIYRVNLVFIHRSNNSSWFCRYNTIIIIIIVVTIIIIIIIIIIITL